MKSCARIATLFAVAAFASAQQNQPSPANPAGEAVAGRDLNAAARSKEAEQERAKRNALQFENQATVLALYDGDGKKLGTIGKRAIYFGGNFSPDRTRVAVIQFDQQNESADLYVMDVASGASTRITNSARTEFVRSPVWSPDGKRIAYATIRTGQEGFYTKAADGSGAEELIYKATGAFLQLSDWSLDGRYLTYSFSDLKGGGLYLLPMEGGAERKPIEVYHSSSRMFGPRFSPDGRYLSYTEVDKDNKGDVFVRSVDPQSKEGPWKVSDAGSFSSGLWRRDGKALYYVARDQSLMLVEVQTSPAFIHSNPKVMFRQKSAVPDRLVNVSFDGERILALPPPRGPQLQQLTIFNRQGQVVQKVGEPALYSQPAFSPDGKRLLVARQDMKNGQQELWTIDIASGKGTKLTSDTWFRNSFVWSSDGKHIYYANFRNGQGGIYRIGSDGTGAEELVFRYTPGAFVGPADVYADGKSIVCESGGVILTVGLAGKDAEGRKEIESLRDEFAYFGARLSPDGRFMAFNSDAVHPEKFEVFVRPYNPADGKVGDKQWRISKNGTMGMLAWRGKEIFFRSVNLNSQDFDMMSVEVETDPEFRAGEPKLLFRLPGPLGGSNGAVSADGQRFVFAVNVPAGKPAGESGGGI